MKSYGSKRYSSIDYTGNDEKLIQHPRIVCGTGITNDYDRVTHSMLENQLRDPIPSMRTLVGAEDKVMNLRPLEKDKHLENKHGDFRYKASS